MNNVLDVSRFGLKRLLIVKNVKRKFRPWSGLSTSASGQPRRSIITPGLYLSLYLELASHSVLFHGTQAGHVQRVVVCEVRVPSDMQVHTTISECRGGLLQGRGVEALSSLGTMLILCVDLMAYCKGAFPGTSCIVGDSNKKGH